MSCNASNVVYGLDMIASIKENIVFVDDSLGADF